MLQPLFNRAGAELEARRAIVIYEFPSHRDHVLRFCERLIEQRKFESNIEVKWISFPSLSKPNSRGGELMEEAAIAELIVFAMCAGGDLPEAVKLWIEGWINRRGEREGALIGVLKHEAAMLGSVSFRELYLRNIAQRAGMSYISRPMLTAPMPDSLDSFNQRAGQITSVLDQILHTVPASRS